jgi:hypothetical protein
MIGERPFAKDVRMNWLTLRVDDAADMRRVLRTLKRTEEVLGLWLYGRSVARVWQLFCAQFKFVQAAGGAVTDQ